MQFSYLKSTKIAAKIKGQGKLPPKYNYFCGSTYSHQATSITD